MPLQPFASRHGLTSRKSAVLSGFHYYCTKFMRQIVRQNLETNTISADKASNTKGALEYTNSRTFVSSTFSMYRNSQFLCKQMQTELRQVLFPACETMLTLQADGHYLLYKHKNSSCRRVLWAVAPRIVEQGCRLLICLQPSIIIHRRV